jgi:multisubunit Na+/H+ antiporter MnhF subunit
MPIRIIDGNKTPEKVTLPVSLDDLYEVIIQLLAVLGLFQS